MVQMFHPPSVALQSLLFIRETEMDFLVVALLGAAAVKTSRKRRRRREREGEEDGRVFYFHYRNPEWN